MDILMWIYDRLLNPNLFSHHTTNCRQATTAVPGDYCQGNKDFSFKPESLPLSAPQPSERHCGEQGPHGHPGGAGKAGKCPHCHADFPAQGSLLLNLPLSRGKSSTESGLYKERNEGKKQHASQLVTNGHCKVNSIRTEAQWSILLVQQWEQMEGGWSTRPPEQHIPTVLPPWLCSPPSSISWTPCVSAAALGLQLPGRAAGWVGLCVSTQGQKSESGTSLCQLQGWERVMGSRTRPDVCYAYSYKHINTRVEYSKML